jgi:hypothetical protein
MHFVLLATHTPETCPTSNSTTRELLLKVAPKIPNIAENSGVRFVAGPFVNREHMIVVIVETGVSRASTNGRHEVYFAYRFGAAA